MINQPTSTIDDVPNNSKEIKRSVNLYSKKLLPKKPLITLCRIIGAWVLVLLLMFSWGGYLKQQWKVVVNEQMQLTNQKNELTQVASELEDKIKNNKRDPVLEERLSTLKLLMNHKQRLYTRLTDAKSVNNMGFSTTMSELAKYHYKDISLEQVSISFDGVTLAGIAKSPDAVPLWLNGLESSNMLSGQTFEEFSLSQNEEKETTFHISAMKEVNE